jgi:undecaprenyl-diphosphatase
VLAILAFLLLHRSRAAALLAITMVGAAALVTVLKLAFHRARPVPFYGASPQSFSFPSGHALGSFCFYGALATVLSDRLSKGRARAGLWLAAAFLIAMIGLSRVYLGVHYPTDVIAGYGAALVWVAAVRIADRLLGARSESL